MLNKMYSKLLWIFLLLLLNSYVAQAQVTNPSGNSSAVKNPIADDDNARVINNLFNAGKWQQGKVILDKEVQKNPKSSDLKFLLGKYYFQLKSYDQARYELNKALEYNPDNVGAKQILVNLETTTKRYSSAICYVNELLQISPYAKNLWLQKISLYELQGNTIEAGRLRKRLFQIYPNDKDVKTDYLYSAETKAAAESKSGNIDKAIELRKEVISDNPKDVQSFIGIINDYLKAGDTYNALAYSNRGLNLFPHNSTLIDKKAGILADQNRYSELLPFLLKEGESSKYNYYLLQAARNARNQEAAVLFGKILAQSPGNEEAFQVVFDHNIAGGQYQEALNNLKKYRQVHGNSRALSDRELMIYKKMGNTGKSNELVKQLFKQYPGDKDLQAQYALVMEKQAKNEMEAAQYDDAIRDWYQVIQYGDTDLVEEAQLGIFNAYQASGQPTKALNALNELLSGSANDINLYVKMADIYFKQAQYHNALAAYEKAIGIATPDQRDKYLAGYSDMQTMIVKEFIATYKYESALNYVNQWLSVDSSNEQALRYATSLSELTNDRQRALAYAQKGHNLYPDNSYFKIQIAVISGEAKGNYEELYTGLHSDLPNDPYNKSLINTFTEIAGKYGTQLFKEHKNKEALAVLDTALNYAVSDSSLKYTKGLIFEQLKQYDSAAYYQSFYKPSVLETSDFIKHINYLKYKSNQNELDFSYLRSRYGDLYDIQTISTIQYSHSKKGNTYSGLINYAGRSTGKGFQAQAEWTHDWSPDTYTTINGALANQFFPTISFNASVFRSIRALKESQLQLGIGYRRLDTISIAPDQNRNMLNFVAGLTKTLDPFSLNLKWNNYLLGSKWLYNLSFDGRYYMNTPKDYLMGVASVGSSPDVQVINYALFNGFSAVNTMVGFGAGHILYKDVTINALGTWFNFKTGNNQYRDLYNIYLNLNIAF